MVITELFISKSNVVTASFSYHSQRLGPLVRTLLEVTNPILGLFVP